MCKKKMDGKNVIVTGSGTGIGREIALEFAREGANVVFHYSHSANGAKSGVEEAKKCGVKSVALQADFSNLDDVLKLGDDAIAFLGKIDILVNNAGISFNKPFLKVEPEQFKKMYDVNIRAQFFLTQTIIRNMIEHGKGGAICNITSIHGVSGAPEHSVYAGTKGAIIAYTRSLAVELAHKGIRVNAVAPGCIPVENYINDIPNYNAKELENAVKDKIPVGRSGKPIEIAKLAVFLCSDEAEFIVGQTIIADGGTTSLMSLISDFRNESSAHFGANYL
jgi:NAD(P)-dependent dehydrogenase (short-subunit alcohol dehydrogenase family)